MIAKSKRQVLKRGLHSEVLWLFLGKTLVGFPAPECQLKTFCNFSSRETKLPSDLLHSYHTHTLHLETIHMK